MTIFEARARVLDIAKSYIGYTEKRTNSQLDDPTANAGSANWNRFARDVDACKGWMHGNKNGFEWCCMFYCGCFLYAFGYPIARVMLYQPEDSYAAKCSYALNYYKKNGALYSNPEPADQIFFDYGKGIAHTGMVSKVTDSYVYTIEGNSDNRVQEKKYARSNKIIAGYGRPKWSLVADIPAEPAPEPVEPTEPKVEVINVETKELSKGSKGQAVKSMQLLLIGNGYSCGDAGADGDFGDATKGAVMAFQKRNRLTQDGICGVKTWTKLING